MPLHKQNIGSLAKEVGKKLVNELSLCTDRKLFFNTLSNLLQEIFFFDRLCINLYDPQGEMLTYFSAAEGTAAITLSPVRPAEASSTVAGHVIATGKPVIITDFAQYFTESSVHPIAEAGLTSTMAFPLMLGNKIIATMHCSFAKQPKNLYEITSLLLEISPFVAICLGSILAFEQSDSSLLHPHPLFIPPAEEKIVYHSKAMRDVIRKVNVLAKLDIPILLLGETGTGKTFLAQEIHRRSTRSDNNFVRVNCPSLAQTLFESELFGHVKGAFTGATGKRVGRFELANGGTLFLDEIAELSSEMQSKLLQVLEDFTFERVGESIPLSVDVRIVTATNVCVGKSLAKGALRPDLFYRLSSYAVELPPLRERVEDIAPLISVISAQASTSLKLPVVRFTSALRRPLLDYEWPGNVRELRNIVSKLVIYHGIHNHLTVQTVESAIQESRLMLRTVIPSGVEHNRERQSPLPSTQGREAPLSLDEVERRHILEVLAGTNGKIAGPTGAASLLGLPRSTLLHRMHKLGITRHGHIVQNQKSIPQQDVHLG